MQRSKNRFLTLLALFLIFVVRAAGFVLPGNVSHGNRTGRYRCTRGLRRSTGGSGASAEDRQRGYRVDAHVFCAGVDDDDPWFVSFLWWTWFAERMF